MFKSSSLSIAAPFVKTQTKTKTKSQNRVAVSWVGAKPRGRSSTAALTAFPVLSAALVVVVAGLLLMHLFWVNTYSAKGFELKKVQNAISEATELQKKLMVQQSMLNSTLSLSGVEQMGMVPAGDEEHLSPSSLANANK